MDNAQLRTISLCLFPNPDKGLTLPALVRGGLFLISNVLADTRSLGPVTTFVNGSTYQNGDRLCRPRLILSLFTAPTSLSKASVSMPGRGG